MRNLLFPTLSAMFSAGGVAWGCHAFGMPPDDVAFATLVAAIVASTAVVGALWLARPRRRAAIRPTAAPLR